MEQKQETLPLGKLTIDIGDESLQKKISSAGLQAQLDQSSVMNVALALTPKEMFDFQANQIPAKVQLKWNDKLVFKGEIAGVEAVGIGKIELRFSDGLELAKKRTENLFFKNQTLSALLKKIADKTTLKVRFFGDFSERLPATSLGDKTLFESLECLGKKYGFYFFAKSVSQELCFLRVGTPTDTPIREIDCEKEAYWVTQETSARHSLSMAKIRYFDPQKNQPEEQTVQGNALTTPIKTFQEHPSAQIKKGWRLSEGSLEAVVTDKHHFDEGESLLKHQSSKMAMQNDQITLRSYQHFGLPGDKIKIKKSSTPNLKEGTYLIQSIRMETEGALPTSETKAIRA